MSATATHTEPFSRVREKGRDEGAPRSGAGTGRTAPALTPALSRARERGNNLRVPNGRGSCA